MIWVTNPIKDMAKTSTPAIDKVINYLRSNTGGNRAVVMSDLQKHMGIRPDSLKETIRVLVRFNQIEIASNGKTTLVWIKEGQWGQKQDGVTVQAT